MDEFGADLLMLHLAGTHPDRGNRSPEEAAADVRAVLDAVGVPLIVKGPGAGSKQNDVLARVAEECQGEGLALHSACQEEYKTLAAVAVAYGHVLVAESPIDMNIAKQLNILLADASVDLHRTLIDPLTGGLGYGLEYTYSVMERIRLAALGGDAMLNSPMICLVGEEAWKAKEAKVPAAGAVVGRERQRGSIGKWPPRWRSLRPARRCWCCGIPSRWRRLRRANGLLVRAKREGGDACH